PPVGVSQPDEDEESEKAREEREREVVSRLANMEDIVVSEVELDRSQSLVTLRGLPDVPGVAASVFEANARAGIVVDMIVQNVSQSDHSHISFTVLGEALGGSLAAAAQVVARWSSADLSHERDIAKLSVLGIGLRTHTGVGEKMFRALADANVNLQMISTSEVRISTVVDLARGDDALKCLTATFGL